jgi:hypothetical protein
VGKRFQSWPFECNLHRYTEDAVKASSRRERERERERKTERERERERERENHQRRGCVQVTFSCDQ